MKSLRFTIVLIILALLGSVTRAEDIDIFTGTTEADPSLPNLIFILDNSANWSKESQKWPDDGGNQGESEIAAILEALDAQVGNFNVGLMMYTPNGGGGSGPTVRDGAYVRFDLQPLTEDSYAALAADLNAIDTNDEEQKRDQSNPYGDLPWDLYNYLRGTFQSKNGENHDFPYPDDAAYVNAPTSYSQFRSPLGDPNDICADTYMIWIGNNRQGGNYVDSSANTTALDGLYDALGKEPPGAMVGQFGDALPVPEITTIETEEQLYTGGTEIPAGETTSQACYKSNALNQCPSDASCPEGANCECTDKVTPNNCGNGKGDKYTVKWAAQNIGGTCETIITTETVPTGDFSTTRGLPYNFDDWTKYLYDKGIPVDVVVDDETLTQDVKVITYAIDVFNAQQNGDLSAVWYAASELYGGGRYFEARTKEAIVDAIETAVGDILAVSSSFAAVSLPLSSTNRAQLDNEVYVGMFRPYPGRKPRWYGNLKRYQLALFGNKVAQLADVKFRRAINPLTGFATDCAQSFWTTDTTDYWELLGVEPSLESECESALTAGKEWSDLPDGPFVEKGGAGQMLRWNDARRVYTVDASENFDLIGNVDAAELTSLGGTDVLNYLTGDIAGSGEIKPASTLRPSAHADVIHSRPLTVRFDEDTVWIFYGANDGFFRAVDTYTGEEKWALVAPEHFPKIERLYDNDPLVLYEGDYQDPDLTYERKDYFFDGPTGYFVKYGPPADPDSDAIGALEAAYIYPTMRRGGRMIYGVDLTADPNDPQLLWRQGCPNLDDNNGCTISGNAATNNNFIGQTWSTPVTGYLGEYKDDAGELAPVVLFGGGFDDCLNADQKAYPSACSAASGKGVYLLNAVTGALIEYFETDAPVVTEVDVIDLNFDDVIDMAYVADVAGNLYRIRFADLVEDLSDKTEVPDAALVARDNEALAEEDRWMIEKIATIPAEADGTQRRFYNSPSAGFFRGTIFVTIGTGDRERPLETNYPYEESVQNNFYVLFDSPYRDLQLEAAVVADGGTYQRRVVDLEDPDDMWLVADELPTDKDIFEYEGFYMELVDRGEQVANPSALGGGKVFFNTYQPGGVSDGVCQRPLGIGKGYTLNLFSPTTVEGNEIAGGGIPIPPIIATVQIPPGCETDNCVPPCEGVDCDPCSLPNAQCETQTLVIGLEGFDPIKIDPEADPERQRVFFTEDMDREAK